MGFKQSLKASHPAIARQADGWDPSLVSAGSNRKVNWRCRKGHKWSASIFRRAKEGSGCPVCSNRKVLPGVNDLATTHPNIAKEILEGDPTRLTAGSDKKLTWRCKLGHSWVASVGSRVLRGTGCPVCSGQRTLEGFNDLQTLFPEIASQADGWMPSGISPNSHKALQWKCANGHIWKVSPNSRTSRNNKNRKDVKSSGCPYCSSKRTLKGFNDLATTHPKIAKRLVNTEDGTRIAWSSPKILEWKCSKGHKFKARVDSVVKSPREGCGICHGKQVLVGENDLATSHPELASQMLDLDPSKYTKGSSKRAKWKCSNGHIWKATIGSRTAYDSSCPICSGARIKTGFNDLRTLNPDLANEAYKWNPGNVGRGSKLRRKWKCPSNHIYLATISDRAIKGSGCPYCSGAKVLKGFNDLATKYPGIAKEALGWDATRVTSGSGRNVLWKCASGHTWKATPQSRATHGTGCPTCASAGFDPNDDGYLYYLIHPIWEMYQIGITNHPERRIGSHSKRGWQILELRGPMDGHLVQAWETAILRMVRSKNAGLGDETIAGRFDGYSEAWRIDGLQASSLSELMRLTEVWEESNNKTKRK